MAKKIDCIVKMKIVAAKATPAPPVGTALGPRGVNIMEFCKAFNAATTNEKPGTPIPLNLIVYSDKSFTMVLKTPETTYLIKEKVGKNKGSSTPGKAAEVATISRKQVEEIAKVKMKDMNAFNLEAACLMVEGTAISMGIKVEG